MSNTDTLRNANLQDMVTMLRDQQARKLDVVVPASRLRVRDGNVQLVGLEHVLTDDGVTDPNGAYRPTDAALASLAERLDIPVRYVRRMRADRPDIFDATVNAWLRGKYRANVQGGSTEVYAPDSRSFLLRLFSNSSGNGVFRAMLSDRYGVTDNLDVLMAVMAGIQQAGAQRANVDSVSTEIQTGLQVEVRSADLTESRMNVKFYSPQVAAMAPALLKGYRNPFDTPELAAERAKISKDIEHWRGIAAREGMDHEPGTEPVVFAGFRVSNSEVGNGAVSLMPEIVIEACKNGLTLPLLGVRKVHLGDRMDEGIWNAEVQERRLALITAQAKQKVSEWLTEGFLVQQVAEVEAACGAPVTKPTDAIKHLAGKLAFTQGEQDGILAHFIAAGQLTAGGIANAITSFSQTVADGDRADALDNVAVKAMSLLK